MKFNHKISIDLKKFITTTKFDCIKLGQSQEWIHYNFPDPDYTLLGEGGDVYNYGSFELYFNKEGKLWMIFSDHFQSYGWDGGESLEIATEIFDTLEQLTLDFALSTLTSEGIDYKKETKNHATSYNILVTLSNGIELIFDNPLNTPCSPNDFVLEVIQLTDLNILNEPYE